MNSGTEANLVEGGGRRILRPDQRQRFTSFRIKSLGFYVKCFESPTDICLNISVMTV